ncbi:MAG: ABC transporter permease [Acidobacteriaceae bacterium]|nr:ABC transporter permease [Acidobacteriaceae bacterium]
MWESVLAVYIKEMTEVFRDRRTMISMVIVPIVILPLLFTVMAKFMGARSKEAGNEARVIAVRSQLSEEFTTALRQAGLEPIVESDLRASVENKQVAAGLDIDQTGAKEAITVYTDNTREASQIAGERVKGALNALQNQRLRKRLQSAGLPAALASPLDIRGINVASQRKMAGFFTGSMVGYLMILLMFTAAMYPAIDMTAGEKERHTLEALLSSGASRDGIMLGKILAAATASFLTGILTLAGLMYSLHNILPRAASAQVSGVNLLEPSTIGLVLVSMVPIALLGASAMLAIALFAKSYKEGQTYVTPLLMVVIFPAILGMLPGLELTPALALIPIFNVSQLVKEIFLGSFSVAAFCVTLAANAVYALIAFCVAGVTFRRESVLFRT